MSVRYSPTHVEKYSTLFNICTSCHKHVKPTRLSLSQQRRCFATTAAVWSSSSSTVTTTTPTTLQRRPQSYNSYFLDNHLLRTFDFQSKTFFRSKRTTYTQTTIETPPPASRLPKEDATIPGTIGTIRTTDVEELPHRRRQKLRHNASSPPSPSSSSLPAHSIPTETPMAPDMPSIMTSQAANLPVNSIKRLYSTLLALSKPRLSFLIVLTTTSAYSLYPVPEMLSPSLTETPSLSALTLLFLTIGTSLTCASANTFNMLYEPKWDAMMSRTKNRPLVRGLISPRGAAIFGVLAGVGGVIALYYGVNPTVAFLGGFNIFLYAGCYTPLKRISVLNTWVGAVVGGIPPLMGWAAAAGQSSTGDGTWRDLLLGEQNIGGWLLAALLVAWQFPHFMALSWPIREEYKAAGYRMLAWTNPARNGRVALRYSLPFIPICIALCYFGITEWTFAVASTPVNVWILREAWKFWRLEGYKGSARGLFWASVWHLPVVMVLAMVQKKGMWQRAWAAAFGEPALGEDEEWIDEEFERGVEEEGGKVMTPPLPASPMLVKGS